MGSRPKLKPWLHWNIWSAITGVGAMFALGKAAVEYGRGWQGDMLAMWLWLGVAVVIGAFFIHALHRRILCIPVAGLCRRCRYDLTGLHGDRCPECGQAFRSSHHVQ